MEYHLNRKKLYIEGWHLDNMNEQLVDWIIRFQRDQDIEALAHLKSYCYNIIEPLIGEFTAKYGEEAGALLRLKWDKRFYFIFTKYQVHVGLPLDTFVQNTYRFYFIQVLKKAGYL
ncbi:hypothetical protein [Lysinibacillus sphaericus]|nr:hypothetical protein [Lysinibacillus sphaericus]